MEGEGAGSGAGPGRRGGAASRAVGCGGCRGCGGCSCVTAGVRLRGWRPEPEAGGLGWLGWAAAA